MNYNWDIKEDFQSLLFRYNSDTKYKIEAHFPKMIIGQPTVIDFPNDTMISIFDFEEYKINDKNDLFAISLVSSDVPVFVHISNYLNIENPLSEPLVFSLEELNIGLTFRITYDSIPSSVIFRIYPHKNSDDNGGILIESHAFGLISKNIR